MKSIKEMEELLEVEEKDRTDYYELEEDAKLLLAWAKKARELLLISVESSGWLPNGDERVKQLLSELPE